MEMELMVYSGKSERGGCEDMYVGKYVCVGSDYVRVMEPG